MPIPKDPPIEPADDDHWGGPALPPAEEPYPPDHPNRRMLEAPAAEALAPGPLSGLFSQEDPPLPFGRRWALAQTLWLVAAGLMIAGGPLAAIDVGLEGFVYQLAVPVGVLLAALTATALGRWAATPRGNAGEASRRANVLKGLTITVALGWLGALVGGMSDATRGLAWAGALVATASVVISARSEPAMGDDSPWRGPAHTPHRLAQALIAGAGALSCLAVILTMSHDGLMLLLRLLALGLVMHAGLAQRSVAMDVPEARLVRVGRLCGAYRWILWVGYLAPLACLAVGLLLPDLIAPAVAFAALCSLPGLWAFVYLEARALQAAQRPDVTRPTKAV